MALISELAARARFDEPPLLVSGPAVVRTEKGRKFLAIPADRADPQAIDPATPLVFDLEAVRSPTDAVEFIRRYGLLKIGPDDVDAGQEVREPYDEWEEEIARIRAIGTLVLLTHNAESGDTGAIRRIRTLLGPDAHDLDDDDALLLASGFVQVQVNERLSNSRWEIRADALDENRPAGSRPGRPNVFWFTARPAMPGALPYAYWQLADLLVARAPLAQCEGCGRFFDRHDPRQRFHDEACRQRAGYRRRTARREGEER